MNAQEFAEKFVHDKGWEVFDPEEKVSITQAHSGDWEIEHKSQYKEDIYQIDNQYFAVMIQRDNSGYWSDGETYDPEVYEVKPEQVTITKWVAV